MSLIDNVYYDDKNKKELIDGKLYVVALARREHVSIMKKLNRKFENYLEGKKCDVYPDTFQVYYDGKESKNYVEPDITVICDKDKLSDRGYEGVPTLVIEILSPSTKIKDTTIKFDLYERIGVKEYWIVDGKDKSIKQYVLFDGKYKLCTWSLVFSEFELEEFTQDDRNKYTTIIKSTIFNDFEIDIKDIFDY